MEDLKSNESVYPVYIDMRSGSFTAALQRNLVSSDESCVKGHEIFNYLGNVSTKLVKPKCRVIWYKLEVTLLLFSVA
jgi:hypothetical protein